MFATHKRYLRSPLCRLVHIGSLLTSLMIKIFNNPPI